MQDNDVNQFTNTRNKISNKNEMLAYMNMYQELCEKYKKASKIEKVALTEKIADMEDVLKRGMKINNNILREYIENIKFFFELIGMDYEAFESKLNSIELRISPVNFLEGGQLCNYANFIAIDYSYCKFDSEGNFISFNETMPGFLKHVVTHELLHTISNKGLAYMDSFSEGMTEYFAHKISKATNVQGAYDYIERIFYIFGSMLGDDLLFQDYITNIYEMKNLHMFISSLGITENEFKSFKRDLDLFLENSFNKKSNTEELNILKSRIENFMFNKIMLPYYFYDKDYAMQMMKKFFAISEEMKLDLCKIHHNSEDEKKL